MQLHKSDLEKVYDAIWMAYRHNKARDEMNAAQHLASTVRWSPLTTVLELESRRLKSIIDDWSGDMLSDSSD